MGKNSPKEISTIGRWPNIAAPDRRADHRRFADRRLANSPRAKLVVQPLAAAHRPAELPDVLADQVDPVVVAHLVGDRRDDRFDESAAGGGGWVLGVGDEEGGNDGTGR